MPSLIVFRSSVNTIIYPYTYPIRATDTFLHTIIRSPSATAAETVEWALNRGYNVDCRDAEDNTPLFCAVSQGIRDITQVLINHGAGIASQSMDGDPPLVLAARNGNYGIVKVLLDNGAPIEDPRSKRSAQALVEAAGRGHSRIVQLLLYRGAKVDQRSSDDWVALSHAAASVGNLDIVQQLVEAGADVNDTASQTDRHLPLAEACHWSHLHIIDYLLEKGADVELRGRMHPVMGGDTLLIAAARGSRFDVCERLLKYGADAEFPDSFGKSAINWAKEIGNERLVKLLQRFRK
jgi:ankyrin repeat protein